MLVAMLNLKLKGADKNAGNLYHLQMASLQVEIELGLLSSSERKRRDWFPIWFSYSMTEAEKRAWDDYVETNPPKWTGNKNDDKGEDQAQAERVPVQSKQGPEQAEKSGVSSELRSRGEEVLENPREQPKENLENGTRGATKSTSLNLEDAKSKDGNQTSRREDPKSSTSTSNFERPVPSMPGPQSTVAARVIPASEVPSQVTDGTDVEASAFLAMGSKLHKTSPARDTPEETDSNETESRLCQLCENPGRLCKGCGIVAYCGKEHQRADWKTHKSFCRKASKGKGKADD
ncbi:hypothetical protein ABW19_dt0202472 [Dactylella cylindrospora]|nr:hypothetical protein ABW19_dt0202472 [Dactylella cylindrospora]